jgi:hypothetical protein
MYGLSSGTYARMKTKAILEFIFGEEIFGRHDPKKEA